MSTDYTIDAEEKRFIKDQFERAMQDGWDCGDYDDMLDAAVKLYTRALQAANVPGVNIEGRPIMGSKDTELQAAMKLLRELHEARMGNYAGDPWEEHPYQDAGKPDFFEDDAKKLLAWHQAAVAVQFWKDRLSLLNALKVLYDGQKQESFGDFGDNLNKLIAEAEQQQNNHREGGES